MLKDSDFINQPQIDNRPPVESPKMPKPVEEAMASDLENKKIEKVSEELIDYLIDHYIDGEGNFSWWQEFEYDDNEENEKNVYKRLGKIYEGEKSFYIEPSLEDFLYSQDAMEMMTNKYKTEKDLFRKIKIIKLYNDVCSSMLKDDEGGLETINQAIDNSKSVKEDSKEGYLVRTFAKAGYLTNLDWHDTLRFGRSEESKEQHKDWFDVKKFHDIKYNSLHFTFDDRMINAMNSCRRCYGAPTEIMNSGDAKPLRKILAAEAPNYDGNSEFVYEGDYIITEVAPGIIGAYTINGDLLGWREVDGNSRAKDRLNPSKIGLNQPKDVINKIGEDNKNDLVLFKIMANLEFRAQIKRDFGIDIGVFDLRTQFQFLNFIKDADESRVKKIKSFIEQTGGDDNKNNRVKTFLALEAGREMGDKILAIGESFKDQPEAADKIFAKYNEIVGLAEKSLAELESLFNDKQNISQADKNLIFQNVLNRASGLLVNFSDKLKSKGDMTYNEVMSELKKYQSDIILFVETFKTLNREGKALELADFKNINISRKSGQEIPDEEKSEFEKIAAENWSKYFFKDEVIEEFKKSLENPDNRFYTVKYGGKTVAFIRFDPQDNCELYAGSLNVRPDLRGSTIGEAVLKTILKEEAHNNTINAKVYSRLPILKRYIGEFGFVATDMINNYHGRAGEYGFKMLLAEEENQGYKFFNRPLKEIKAEHHDNTYALNQPEIVLKFDSLNEQEVMMGQCQKLLDYGYVLTAYRPEKEKTGSGETESVYLAFEKRARQLEQAA